MRRPINRCRKCYYYDESRGVCCYSPPVPMPNGVKENGYIRVLGVLPNTHPDSWCSKWEGDQ